MEKPLWMWVIFLSIVAALLLLDLGVFHKKQRDISVQESLWMSGFYIFMALLFGGWIWYQLGAEVFAEYLTGFMVEKSLSLDNIFVISLIFTGLSIPLKYQHRVLFWGILGVIVLRAMMIALGAQLLHQFWWILYVFSLFMVITGIKMLVIKETPMDISQNKVLAWIRRHLRVTETLHGRAFVIRQMDPATQSIHLYATPLLVALILIELIDLIFAVDSVPAIFTITKDPYIVYTSNIFAILGLRALYFALAAVIDRFHCLKLALALILIFIGSKIFVADLLELEKFPPMISLGVTFGLIGLGCLCSVLYPKRPQE